MPQIPLLHFLTPLLIFTSSATAEVCDKIAGDSWTPAHGPVNTLTTTKIVGWIAAFALVAVIIGLLKSKRLARVAAVLAALLAILPSVVALLDSDESMTEAAIQEGCWAGISTLSALAVALAFAFAAAFFVWMARTRFVRR